jgi:hypothetical protein
MASGQQFQPPPLESLTDQQKVQDVTIGVKAFDTKELAEQAFGGLNPLEYGVLPVYMVVENKSGQVIDFEGMRVTYIDLDNRKIEATPAGDVRSAIGPSNPNLGPRPQPLPLPRNPVRKNPLANPVIMERAFSGTVLPPDDSARGFLYFQTDHRGSARIYITGLTEKATGNELFYFEIPLDASPDREGFGPKRR